VAWFRSRRRASDATTREALERGRLVEELHGVVVDIAARLDHHEVIHRIARSAVELVGADGGAYAEVAGGRSTVVAVHGLPESISGVTIGPGEGLMGEVIASGRMVVVGDYHADSRRVPAVAAAIQDLHTVVAVPSVLGSSVAGALFAVFRQRDRPVTDPERAVLSLLAAHAATSLANASAFGAVLRREAHEKAVVEALADGVAVLSPAGVVTSWNSAAAAMTGVPTTEAVGRPAPVPVDVATRPGAPVEHQLPDDRWIEVVATELRDTRETILVLRDISDRKELERAQNLFLATTTHEIKTPLTVISGFAATLQRRSHEMRAADRERALQTIVRRSEALVRLINQLLLGFRIQAGQIEVELRAVDLRGPLQTSVAEFTEVSDDHTITLDVPPDLPRVVADPQAVEDVVGQLLENALKYSPDGGTVTVAARVAGAGVTVSVSDKGVGFAPDEAERIFDRFYRGSAVDDHRIGGTGLGLYIVRRLVEAQGGRVRAHGAPGAGATVEFDLPLAQPASVNAHQ